MSLKKIKKTATVAITLSVVCAQALMGADLRTRNEINSQNTKITIKTQNDIDVVNIMDPVNGTSHNKFNKFDIYGGVILNNSMKDGDSVIGGRVEKNNNLKNEANLIITEVTSSNPTSLNGAVEVFGKKADLIFSNENGFNINGADFINTNGVTISTGLYNNGTVSQKGNGKVNILEKGVRVEGDYFNVIADAINLTGDISHLNYTKNLENVNLISGKNTVDLSDKKNPKITASQTSNTEGFSVDGGDLNSIYGDKVKIISTNEGLGVRHEGLITSLEDVEIKAKGDIQTNIIESKNISMEAKNISTKAVKADDVNLKAAELVLNDGLMSVNNNIKISGNNVINSWDISNSLEKYGLTTGVISGKNINITAKNLFLNGGSIVSDNFNLLWTQDFLNDGYMRFGNTSTIVAKNIYSNTLISDNILNISASNQLVNEKNIEAKQLKISATNELDNRGVIFSDESIDISKDNLILSNSGSIGSNNNLDINVKKITNENSGYSKLVGNNVKVTTKEKFDNYGLIATTNKFTFNSNAMQNFGTISSKNEIDVTAKSSFANDGEIFALGAAKFNAPLVFKNNGKLLADSLAVTNAIANTNPLAVALGNYENSGVIQTIGDMSFTTYSLVNKSILNSGKDLTLNFNNKTSLKNTGTIIASGDMNVNAKSIVFNNELGKIYGMGGLNLNSNTDIEINARLENIGDINLKAQKDIKVNDVVASYNALTATGKNLTNNAYMLGNTVDIITNDTITNNSVIDSMTDMTLKSNTITNNGSIFANGNVDIEANTLNNTAKITQNLTTNTNTVSGYGWVGYGDTLFKTWSGTVNINSSSYTNNILANLSTIKGASININTQSKNTNSQINNNGIIYGDVGLTSYGNIKNSSFTTSKKVTEILSDMKVSQLKEKEWLGSWNTNGSKYFSDGTNLLEMLKYFADEPASKLKDHQRETAWKAIKDASTKDANLKSYLSLLLGADYLSKTFPPKSSEWNKDAKIIFSTNSGAKLGSDGSVKLISQSITNGDKKNESNTQATTLKELLEKITNIINKTNKQDISLTIESNAKASTTKELIDRSMPSLKKSIFKTSNTDKYLITTDLKLLNQEGLYGSNYFLTKLGQTTNTQIIGDPYYEQRLLNNMLNEISLGFLTNDDIKTLIDNAIEQKNTLGLKLGKELTDTQLENMKSDLVWYVKSKVDGKEVLVPRIYLKDGMNISKSTIKAGTDLIINTDKLTTDNGSLIAGDNLIINGDISSTNSNILANRIFLNGNNVDLYSVASIGKDGNVAFANGTVITAKDYLAISALNNLNIYASIINSGGTVNLSGDNVNILNALYLNSAYNFVNQNGSFITTASSIENSFASNIIGEDVYVSAGNFLNIIGSNVFGENLVNLEGKNVNIKDSISNVSVNTNSVFSGINSATNMFELMTTTNNQLNQALSNGSTIASNGNVVVTSSNDTTIKGSNIKADLNLVVSGNNVYLLNGTNEINNKNTVESFQALGYSNVKDNVSASTSTPTVLEVGGNVYLLADNNLKLVGTNIDVKGILNMSGDNVSIEASKNKLKQTTTKDAFGLVANLSAGLAGYGYEANWVSVDNQSGQVTYLGSQSDYNQAVNGMMLSDALAKVETGVEFTHNNQSIDQISYIMSLINADNVNIQAKNKADIGGGNYKVLDAINVLANSIDTTKYKDTKNISSNGFSVYAKQTFDTTSGVASLINQTAQNVNAANSGLSLNAGLVAAQGITNAVNLITGDLVSGNSYQSAGFGYNNYNASATKENILNMEAANIALQTLAGDLNLNGVNFNAHNIDLNSAKNINISAAKETSNSTSYGVSAEMQTTQTAGVGTLDGANAQGGVGASLSGYYSNEETVKYLNSVFNADNNLNLSANGDAIILGANINGKDVTISVDKDLVIKSLADKLTAQGFKISAGGDLSLGVSSNTIFTGDASLNAGVGYNTTNSNQVGTQSGITASGSINGNIGGNLDLVGSVISSLNKDGNLNVNGKINLSDLKVYKTSDGAYVAFTAGTEGSAGVDVNIDDHIAENGLLLSAVNILVNNKLASNTDVKNTLQVNNNSWAGGSMNVSAELDTIKNIVNKIKGSPNNSNTNINDIVKTELENSNIKLKEDDLKNFQAVISSYNTSDGRVGMPAVTTNNNTSSTYGNEITRPLYDELGKNLAELKKELEEGKSLTEIATKIKEVITEAHKKFLDTADREGMKPFILKNLDLYSYLTTNQSTLAPNYAAFIDKVSDDAYKIYMDNKKYLENLDNASQTISIENSERVLKDITEAYWKAIKDNGIELTRSPSTILQDTFTTAYINSQYNLEEFDYFDPGVIMGDSRVLADPTEAHNKIRNRLLVYGFHEMTHKLQFDIVVNKNSFESDDIKAFADILKANWLLYLTFAWDGKYDTFEKAMQIYKAQPLEYDAITVQEKVDEKISVNNANNPLYLELNKKLNEIFGLAKSAK